MSNELLVVTQLVPFSISHLSLCAGINRQVVVNEESYVKGLANRNGPESCAGWRDPSGEALTGEALTGESAGWVLSGEINSVRHADPFNDMGKATTAGP